MDKNPVQTAGIILLACALAVVIGLFTKGWASASAGREEVKGGLLGFEACTYGACNGVDWEIVEKGLDLPGDLGAFRILGLLSGLAAIGCLGAAGGLALARKPDKIPHRAFQAVAGVAAGTLTYFTIRLSSLSGKGIDFGPSYSWFLTLAGLVVAGVVLHTIRRPTS